LIIFDTSPVYCGKKLPEIYSHETKKRINVPYYTL